MSSDKHSWRKLRDNRWESISKSKRNNRSSGKKKRDFDRAKPGAANLNPKKTRTSKSETKGKKRNLLPKT